MSFTGCKEWYYMFRHNPDWWDNKEEAVATVVQVLHYPETSFKYTFYAEGYRYEGWYSFINVSVKSIVPGSKFKVAYNPSKPEENHIQLHTQLFEDGEKVAYTVGQVGPNIRIRYVERDSFELIRLHFSIVVGNRMYPGIANHFINTEGYSREEIVSKKFKVKYWPENPWRSIILLDEPVEE